MRSQLDILGEANVFHRLKNHSRCTRNKIDIQFHLLVKPWLFFYINILHSAWILMVVVAVSNSNWIRSTGGSTPLTGSTWKTTHGMNRGTRTQQDGSRRSRDRSEWVRGLESNTHWQSSTLRMEPTKWGVRNSFSDRGVTSSVRSPWQQIHSWVKTWQGGKQGPWRLVSPTQPSRTSFHSNYCRSWLYRLWASWPSLVTGLTRETKPT